MPNLPETFIAFFCDPQARRDCDAAVFRVRSGAAADPLESRRSQSGDHRERNLAAWHARRRSNRCSMRRSSIADRSARDRRSTRRPRCRNADARGARPLVARCRRRPGTARLPTAEMQAEDAGDPALHVGYDRRAQGMRLDPYRLHRLDGDPRHHHLRRLQTDGSLLLFQRYGLDGRRDVRLYPELCRRQPADRRGHAGLSRHRAILAPDRRSPGNVSRRVADDRAQPDAPRAARSRVTTSPACASRPPAARHGPRRHGSGSSNMSASAGFRSSIFRAAPKSAAASLPGRPTTR